MPRFPCGVPIGLAGVAFVADDGAGLNVGPDVEQGFEVTPVEGLAAGQIKGDDVAGGVRFCVDFRGEAAARAAERLAFLPPFAPAAISRSKLQALRSDIPRSRHDPKIGGKDHAEIISDRIAKLTPFPGDFVA